METISVQKNNPYLDASANKQGPQTCRFHWQVGQTPGELKKALDILAAHELSLSNIESQVLFGLLSPRRLKLSIL